MATVTELERQVACVRREIALRRRVYPKWVAAGRMPKAKADTEIAEMEAVLATVTKVLGLAQVSEQMQGDLFKNPGDK